MSLIFQAIIGLEKYSTWQKGNRLCDDLMSEETINICETTNICVNELFKSNSNIHGLKNSHWHLHY